MPNRYAIEMVTYPLLAKELQILMRNNPSPFLH